jgi:sarcosine oxidase
LEADFSPGKNMPRVTDVIVIGLGAMGSAATESLARNGHSVAAFDRFTPPHSHGSSHGLSRIFRQAYWEDPRYVYLLLRARELWHQLEQDSGTQLLHTIGGLMIGPKDGQLVSRSAESARQFGLPHEIFSAQELKRRWPVFHVEPDSIALLEHTAGYLSPEKCVEQQLVQAARWHAQLHYDEPVLEWSAASGGVTVRTDRGTYMAEHLVITPGPWAPQLLAEMGLPLRVTRQVLYWFEPKENIDLFREDRLPIYMFEAVNEALLVYGFPLTGPVSEGVKVAVHGSNQLCTPETICREILPEDERYIRERLAETLPSLAGRLLRAETCLYTMTPDENFIIGTHPHHPAVTVAAGFSGHGFKFAPVIGEILGQLATTGKTSQDIEMFSPARFATSPG